MLFLKWQTFLTDFTQTFEAAPCQRGPIRPPGEELSGSRLLNQDCTGRRFGKAVPVSSGKCTQLQARDMAPMPASHRQLGLYAWGSSVGLDTDRRFGLERGRRFQRCFSRHLPTLS